MVFLLLKEYFHLGLHVILLFDHLLNRVALKLHIIHGLEALLPCHHERVVLLVHIFLSAFLELFQCTELRL